MKKRLLALLLVLSLLPLPALAMDPAAEPWVPQGELEEAFAALIEETASHANVALGYRNTVTGEEYYANGDDYIVGASLYKTPLIMVYAERIARGELTFADEFAGKSFEDIFSSVLTYSSNEPAEQLLGDLGGYVPLRRAIAEYLGEDSEDEAYLRRTNRFSAREMVHCMNLLATEGERFPKVVDNLLLSAPGLFLKTGDPDYEIAQKYGNLNDGGIFFHAAGIIYTEQPIAVCVMTFGRCDSNALYTRFVELVTKYTEDSIVAQKAAEEQARQEEEARQLEEARLTEEARLAEEAAEARQEEARKAEEAQREQAQLLAQEQARAKRLKTLALFGAALLLTVLFLLLGKKVPLLFLFFALLPALALLRPDSGEGGGSGDTLRTVGTRLEKLLSLARSRELDEFKDFVVHYSVDDSAVAGPRPSAEGYGQCADYGEFQSVLEANRSLLGGETLMLSAETELQKGSVIRYYADETVFAVVWRESCSNQAHQAVTATFAEIRIADGSQFRRKLGDNSYGSSIQKYPTEFAAETNAVLAVNGDFYRFQNTGVHVYNGTVYAWDNAKTDSCLINSEGELLFLPAGTLGDKSAVEQYVRDNDIRFGISFGPIMIEDGKNVTPAYYWMGQANDNYPRCALVQQGKLHYVIMTVHSGATVNETAQWLVEKGAKRAYALDGGQSAVIILGGELCNPMDQYMGSERTMSDILYFCTALPEERGEP